jgi:hypothetical protein
MPGARLPMRKIRDVLRLRACGMSKRQIAASLSIGQTAAGDCIRRARRAGLSWPLPEDLSDEALERLVYPSPPVTAHDRRPQPDWPTIHRELRRPGVTLQLLWEEHRSTHTPTVMATAGSVNFTAPLRRGCRRPCGSHMSLANGCSWTTPGQRWR